MTNVTLFSFSLTKFVCPAAALDKSPASVPALSAFCLPSSVTFTVGVYPSVSFPLASAFVYLIDPIIASGASLVILSAVKLNV